MPASAQSGARRRSSAPRRGTAPAAKPGVVDIYDRVLVAILEHRLPPGTQLVEERLAAVFGVSRTKIRHALARLAQGGIVTVYPNRGAFVASPTREEAHEVFDACRLIEPALVRRLAGCASPAQVRRLREHLRKEQAARKAGDRNALVRLTGDFHVLVAEMAGNRVLARAMREIEALSSLVLLLYDSGQAPMCREDEHVLLVDAIEAGKADRAAKLMLEHLDHIESALDLRVAAEEAVDLEAVFA